MSQKKLLLDPKTLSKRVIHLRGLIKPKTAKYFCEAMFLLNAESSTENIYLYIDSLGGDATSALSMYDVIRNSRAPVIGIVYRRAYSMASLILQACSERLAFEHSFIRLHCIHFNLVEVPVHELRGLLASTKKIIDAQQKRLGVIYSRHTNLSMKEMADMLVSETEPISPPQAIILGLIDRIVTNDKTLPL